MPTYLLTQDALNVPVSCFANYDTPYDPVTITMQQWLTSAKYRAKIEALRLVDDKAKRDEIKSTLPAITPSGTFTYRRTTDLIQHSGLIQFDIDLKDNPQIRNYDHLKEQISKLPFVAFCALSASGKGYWGLVPIAYPERHKQHFDALKRVFAHYNINLDSKPRSVVSLRGYSFDDKPYLPDQVMLFDLYDEPVKSVPKLHPLNLTRDTVPNNTERDRNLVETCLQEVLRRGMYLGESYDDWYEIGCGLANVFGETGRDYFHQLSQKYPKNQADKTDKQFTDCLKASSNATLGTFFYFCKQVGIEWKDLTSLAERPALMNEQAAPVYAKPKAEQIALPGYILSLDEPQLKRDIIRPPERNEPDGVPMIKKILLKWRRILYDFVRRGLSLLQTNEPQL